MNDENWYQDAIDSLAKRHVATVIDDSTWGTPARGQSVAWLKDWLAGRAKPEFTKAEGRKL